MCYIIRYRPAIFLGLKRALCSNNSYTIIAMLALSHALGKQYVKLLILSSCISSHNEVTLKNGDMLDVIIYGSSK